MSWLGIVIVIVLCVVLAIALFFEVRSLVKTIHEYKKKKNKSKENDVKKESTEDK